MTSEPTDRFFGTPLSEWMAGVPNELTIDAVGLWQIIPSLRKAFGLEGNVLELAARSVVSDLLARGADPIIGCSSGPWRHATEYGDTPAAIVDAIMAEWHAKGGSDPDVEDVWFALPAFYKR